MSWPWETRTSTCRNFATISSGLYRFLAIAVLLDVETYLKSDHFVGGVSVCAMRRLLDLRSILNAIVCATIVAGVTATYRFCCGARGSTPMPNRSLGEPLKSVKELSVRITPLLRPATTS